MSSLFDRHFFNCKKSWKRGFLHKTRVVIRWRNTQAFQKGPQIEITQGPENENPSHHGENKNALPAEVKNFWRTEWKILAKAINNFAIVGKKFWIMDVWDFQTSFSGMSFRYRLLPFNL